MPLGGLQRTSEGTTGDIGDCRKRRQKLNVTNTKSDMGVNVD